MNSLNEVTPMNMIPLESGLSDTEIRIDKMISNPNSIEITDAYWYLKQVPDWEHYLNHISKIMSDSYDEKSFEFKMKNKADWNPDATVSMTDVATDLFYNKVKHMATRYSDKLQVATKSNDDKLELINNNQDMDWVQHDRRRRRRRLRRFDDFFNDDLDDNEYQTWANMDECQTWEDMETGDMVALRRNKAFSDDGSSNTMLFNLNILMCRKLSLIPRKVIDFYQALLKAMGDQEVAMSIVVSDMTYKVKTLLKDSVEANTVYAFLVTYDSLNMIGFDKSMKMCIKPKQITGNTYIDLACNEIWWDNL